MNASERRILFQRAVEDASRLYGMTIISCPVFEAKGPGEILIRPGDFQVQEIPNWVPPAPPEEKESDKPKKP